ncbi:MAG: BrnT family toxin [Terriglobia bacterium]
MLKFEWDPQKAARNLAQHSVPFEEAATVFGDPLGRITSDPRHSGDEERFVPPGLSREQRLLAVMFAERGEAIRLISARQAIPRERRDYEQRES